MSLPGNLNSMEAPPLAETKLPGVGLAFEMIEAIWQMAVAAFPATNNELVIPKFIALQLNDSNINELKNRVSTHLGCATTAVVDKAAQVVRIQRAREGWDEGSPSTVATSASASSVNEGFAASIAAGRRIPKSKVRRPANAFILYRQKYHPIVKADQPALHNNQISVILGKQWKAECEEVKDEFRKLAEKVKKQHAAEHPGYQYAPRKASEKKRRMTARKLARLQEGAATDSKVISAEVIGATKAISATDSEVIRESFNFSVDAYEGELNDASMEANGSTSAHVERDPDNNNNNNKTLTMPTGHDVEHEYGREMERQGQAIPFGIVDNRRKVASSTPNHVTNDQSLMETLFDWEGYKADRDIIFESVNADEGVNDAKDFQEKLNRILWMFE